MSKTLISIGGDFGDTGKGEQNFRMLYELVTELGLYGDHNYAKQVLEYDSPLQALEQGRVVFNYSPFGGGNAGNNIYDLNRKKMDTHILPPGTLLAPYTISMKGMKSNVHVGDLIAETEKARRITGAHIVFGKNLFIDRYATITTDQDKKVDAAKAGHLSGTKTGNGPAMASRAYRDDIRANDLLHLDNDDVMKRIKEGIKRKNNELQMYGADTIPEESIVNDLRYWANVVGEETVQDGYAMMRTARQNPNARIFINATQGIDLDNSRGTIGFNLSYDVTPGVVLDASYLPVDDADREWVIIKKFYVTRAGAGPFPGVFEGEQAEYLVDQGKEIGVTSGNRRRPARDNLVSTQYQIDMIRGDDKKGKVSIVYVKGDVYGDFQEEFGPQRVIVGFQDSEGNKITHRMSFPEDLDGVETILSDQKFSWGSFLPLERKEMDAEIKRIREAGWEALPEGMKEFLTFAAKEFDAPISGVSIGPYFGDTVIEGLYDETVSVTSQAA